MTVPLLEILGRQQNFNVSRKAFLSSGRWREGYDYDTCIDDAVTFTESPQFSSSELAEKAYISWRKTGAAVVEYHRPCMSTASFFRLHLHDRDGMHMQIVCNTMAS